MCPEIPVLGTLLVENTRDPAETLALARQAELLADGGILLYVFEEPDWIAVVNAEPFGLEAIDIAGQRLVPVGDLVRCASVVGISDVVAERPEVGRVAGCILYIATVSREIRRR